MHRFIVRLFALSIVMAFVITVAGNSGKIAAAPNSSDEMENPHTTITSSGEVFDASRASPERIEQLIEEAERSAKERAGKEAEVQPNQVIGPDERTRVPTTEEFPYNSIVRVYLTDGGRCTGFLFRTLSDPILSDTVITAGHCVYREEYGGWRDVDHVVIGQNGDPDGKQHCNATETFAVSGWLSLEDPDYDYGGIKLDCNPTFSFGHFKLLYWDDNLLDGRDIQLAGYPEDKTPGTMWESSGTVQQVGPLHFDHDIDMIEGQSGGPIWTNAPVVHNLVLGINRGYTDSTNKAVRITEAVYYTMHAWQERPPK